jgi:GMP synthase-like glutamine amidotransferase
MKIHAIHHVAYEGLGFIGEWIKENGLSLSQTHTYSSAEFPSIGDFDGLIIMGGPMSVHQEEQHIWLKEEKTLIKRSIESGKKVFGVCLGAQLIAECLGSKVYRNLTPEKGWFPIRKTFLFHSWFAEFDDREEATVLHWHTDTFDIPEGAVRLFKSDACENQAFQYEDNVLGLQFHLEMDHDHLKSLIDHSGDGLSPMQFVQHPDKMLECAAKHQEKSREILFDLLSCLFLEED